MPLSTLQRGRLVRLALLSAFISAPGAPNQEVFGHHELLDPAQAGAREARAQAAGTARISGRVTSLGSGPLHRVQVTLSGASSRDRRMTLSDPQGGFEFQNLPAGRYTVQASKTGYVSMRFGARNPVEPGRPIELAEGQHRAQINISLPRGGAISGRVVDEFGEPVPDAAVQALRYQMTRGARRLASAGRARQTDDRGRFRIWGLQPGTYYVSAVVRATWSDGDGEERVGFAPTYYPGTPDVAAAQRVVIAAGQDLDNLDFALVPSTTVRISGSVVDSRGTPLAGGRVGLVRRGSDQDSVAMASARVGRDGSFSIAGVSPGAYVLQASGKTADGRMEFGAIPLHVTGPSLSGVAVTTARGSTIAGQFAFEGSGNPAFSPAGLTVSARTLSDEAAAGSDMTTRVREDWTFQLGGLFGHRVFRATGVPPPWSLKSILLGGADVTDAGVEFQAGEQVSGLRIVLTDRTTTVSGAATDSRGVPAKDYTVLVFAEDRSRWGQHSRFVEVARGDQKGQYEIIGLPPASYLVVALEFVQRGEWYNPDFLEALQPMATKFSLAEGQSLTLPLRLSTSP